MTERLISGSKQKVTYQYHENEIPFRISSYDWKDRLNSEYIYNAEFNIQSRLIISFRYQEYLYRVDTSEYLTLFDYGNGVLNNDEISLIDKNTTPTMIHRYKNGVRIKENTIVNSLGLPVEIREGDNVTYIYTYTMDNFNNWTRKETYYLGELQEIETREFVYY